MMIAEALPPEAHIASGMRWSDLKGDNRRFMFDAQVGEMLLGIARGSPTNGSHATEYFDVRGTNDGYDRNLRGWVGMSGSYRNGVIHFSPPVKGPSMFDRGWKALEWFVRAGATGRTIVRGFGDQWEQRLEDIMPGLSKKRRQRDPRVLVDEAGALADQIGALLEDCEDVGRWVTIRGHPVCIDDKTGKPIPKKFTVKKRKPKRYAAPDDVDVDDEDDEDPEEREERFEAESEEWRESLKGHEKEAFESWIEDSSSHRDAAVKDYDGDDPCEDDESEDGEQSDDCVMHQIAVEQVEAMERAMKRAPKFNGTLYRGVDNLSEEMLSLGMKGAAYTTKAPTSYSANEDAARKFVTGESHGIMYVTEADDTTGAVPISKLGPTKYWHEEECLVPRRAHIVVKRTLLTDECEEKLREHDLDPVDFGMPPPDAEDEDIEEWKTNVSALPYGVYLTYNCEVEVVHDDHAETDDKPDPQLRLFAEARALRDAGRGGDEGVRLQGREEAQEGQGRAGAGGEARALIERIDALLEYDPDQPRDDRGRWTDDTPEPDLDNLLVSFDDGDIVVTKSARAPGKVQTTYFTREGRPSGHDEHDSPVEAVTDLVMRGKSPNHPVFNLRKNNVKDAVRWWEEARFESPLKDQVKGKKFVYASPLRPWGALHPLRNDAVLVTVSKNRVGIAASDSPVSLDDQSRYDLFPVTREAVQHSVRDWLRREGVGE